MITLVMTLGWFWILRGQMINVSSDAWLIFAGLFILSLSNEFKGK